MADDKKIQRVEGGFSTDVLLPAELIPQESFDVPTKKLEPLLSGPKRQHYLPRFYLEGFTRNGLLAVYDRDANAVRTQPPENTAVIGHFYTMEDSQGRKRFEVEQALSEMEANAAPVVKKLAGRGEITAEERAHLAIFLAMAAVRTPDLIDSIKLFHSGQVRRLAKMLFADVDTAKASLKRKPDSVGTEEEIEREAGELVDFIQGDQYEIETSHQWAVKMALHLFTAIAPILAGRNWRVVHRYDEKKSFVTSDAPLVLTTVAPRETSFWGVGFGNSDSLVIFPLTASCVLLVFGAEGQLDHDTANEEWIRRLNFGITGHCQRFVIGRDEALVASLAKRAGLAKRKWQPKMSAAG